MLRPDWANKDEELRSYPMLLTKENYETHKEVLDPISDKVTLDDKEHDEQHKPQLPQTLPFERFLNDMRDDEQRGGSSPIVDGE